MCSWSHILLKTCCLKCLILYDTIRWLAELSNAWRFCPVLNTDLVVKLLTPCDLSRKWSCFCCFRNLSENSLNIQYIYDLSHLLWIFDENTKYEKIIWSQHCRRLISLMDVFSKLSKNDFWSCFQHGQRTVFQGYSFFPPSDVIKHVMTVASATIVCSNLLHDRWSKSGMGPKFVWVIVYRSLLSTRVHVPLVLWVYRVISYLLATLNLVCSGSLTQLLQPQSTIILLALLLWVRNWSE